MRIQEPGTGDPVTLGGLIKDLVKLLDEHWLPVVEFSISLLCSIAALVKEDIRNPAIFAAFVFLALMLVNVTVDKRMRHYETLFRGLFTTNFVDQCPLLDPGLTFENPVLRKIGPMGMTGRQDIQYLKKGIVPVHTDAQMRDVLIRTIEGLEDRQAILAVLVASCNLTIEDGKRWFVQLELMDFLEKEFCPKIGVGRTKVYFLDPRNPGDIKTNKETFWLPYVKSMYAIDPGCEHYTYWLSREYSCLAPEKEDEGASYPVGAICIKLTGTQQNTKQEVYVRWTGAVSGFRLEELEKAGNGLFGYVCCGAATSDREDFRAMLDIFEEVQKLDGERTEKIDDNVLNGVFKDDEVLSARLQMISAIEQLWTSKEVDQVLAVDTTITRNRMYAWFADFFYRRIQRVSSLAAADRQERHVQRLFLHSYSSEHERLSDSTLDRIANLLENNNESHIEVSILSQVKARRIGAKYKCSLDFNLCPKAEVGWHLRGERGGYLEECRPVPINKDSVRKYHDCFRKLWDASKDNAKELRQALDGRKGRTVMRETIRSCIRHDA